MSQEPLKRNAGPEQIERARQFRKAMPLAEQKLGKRFADGG